MPPRTSIREQIAAKRAEVRNSTPDKRAAAETSRAALGVSPSPRYQGRGGPAEGAVGTGGDEVVEDKTVESQIRKAVRSGKLDISSLKLDRIPPEVYTTLLGVPTEDLSRPPPRVAPRTDIQGTNRTFSATLRIAEESTKEDVFGQKKAAAWVEPEELTAFRAGENGVDEIETELGGFGGLKTVDLHRNRMPRLPRSFADLLRLTTLDLSNNALVAFPPELLLLPKLEVLDLSANAINTLDFSSPVEPSEEGLSYGAGFLTTSFSRWGGREALPLLPVLRSLNLGFNKLTNAALEALRIEGGLKTMRVLNLENNALEGELDAELIGLGQDRMPELAVLNLSGNVYLREVVGELASGAKVEMAGCNVRDAPRGQTSASNGTWGTSNQAGTKAPTAAAGGVARPDLPVPKPDLTLVYRTYPAATFDSEPLDVDFDLYLPPNPTGKPLPLIIWFHGGGLLQGNKENLPPHFRRLPAHAFPTPEGERHVAVISPNYRLAPQVPILDILADMSALFDFVRTKLNDRLAKDGQEHTVDTDRICLSGGSAGGYLALIGGLAMPSKATDEQVGGYRGHAGIRCIAPFYPITDLTDAFWATETIPVPWSSRVIPHDEARPHIDLKAPPIKTAISGGPRSVLYTYMLQHGLFPGLLFLKQRSVGSGLDGFRPSPEALSITTRLQLLTKLGAQRPPVYLVYGTADRAVQPFEKTVECLRESTGELEVEVREGADHAFDEETSEECEAFREWVGVKLFA